jgi:hypothetical protein
MSCRQLCKNLNILPVPCMHTSRIIYNIKLHTEEMEQNAVMLNPNIQ